MTTIQFSNRPPLQFAKEKIDTIYDANQEWGHFRIAGYRGEKNTHVWTSYNSGQSYGGKNPDTIRQHLIAAPEPNVRSWTLTLTCSSPDETQHGWTQPQIDAVRAWLGIEAEIA